MKKILVLGGAHIDRRGMIETETAPGASNPGSWMEEAGGGGFNAARNLSRLGFQVRIIAPRGGDVTGEAVAEAARQAGVEDTPFTFLDRTHTKLHRHSGRDGNLVIALADMDLIQALHPAPPQDTRCPRGDNGERLSCFATQPARGYADGTWPRCPRLRKAARRHRHSPAKAVKLKAALGDIDIPLHE